MKLLVGFAVMDAVDHRRWRLDDGVVIRKQDLSLAVQPLAKLVTDNRCKRRSMTWSDAPSSTATARQRISSSNG
jgi:beta-lactamase class A